MKMETKRMQVFQSENCLTTMIHQKIQGNFYTVTQLRVSVIGYYRHAPLSATRISCIKTTGGRVQDHILTNTKLQQSSVISDCALILTGNSSK